MMSRGRNRSVMISQKFEDLQAGAHQHMPHAQLAQLLTATQQEIKVMNRLQTFKTENITE